MRICASRQETGLLRQTIVATWRKRSQMRTRQASPDPGPLQGSLLHAPRSGCQPGPLRDRAGILPHRQPSGQWPVASEGWGPANGRGPTRSMTRPTAGSYLRSSQRLDPTLWSGLGPDLWITRRPARRRSIRPPLPGQPRRPVRPRPGCRPGSAFPNRSARSRCGGGWRGTTDRYRPGSDGRR